MNYLRRYVGTYRVKADYDTYTNDFPRDEFGNIDPSFDDYYIVCDKNVQIRHAWQSMLWCYIPNITKGRNILKQLYNELLCEGKKDWKKLTISDEKLCNDLNTLTFLKNVEFTDGEVCFDFSSNQIEIISKIVKPSTKGKNINPLSSKNLPKKTSCLSTQNKVDYKKATQYDLSKVEIMQLIKSTNESFAKKNLPKDYKLEMKKLKLDFKSYVYSKQLWDKYIDVLKKAV